MTHIIEAHNLSFTYPSGRTTAVDNIDFHVSQGEILGFLGPSGAGKSTTQKIIIGLLKGYGGSVRILDREIADWNQEIYENIGVGFELPNHYLKLTARENLSHFASLYSGETESIDHLLNLVALSEDADTLVGQFSKGMRMRLNFVRAFIHKPQIIFYDEPTAGLDPVNGRKIKDIILAQREAGKTIFLTTHDMAVADELCDRVAFIVDGQINTVGTPEALKQAHGQRKISVTFGENGRSDVRDFPLDNLGENNEFLQLIRENYVQKIHTQEATLENIFIQVTGRALD